jgi:hypothetical protein
MVQRAVPLLKYIEKIVHPRWYTPFEPTKRVVGVIVLTLCATLSNVVPALVIALIALFYLEEDGILLTIALLAAVVVLAIALAAGWETIRGAEWMRRLLYLIVIARCVPCREDALTNQESPPP